MLVLLPFFAWLSIFQLTYSKFFREFIDVREKVLLTTLIWEVYLILITELLSFFHAFTTLGVALSWSSALLLTLVLNAHYNDSVFRFSLKTHCSDIWRQLSDFSKFCIGAITCILLITGFIALIAAPNTPDSLAYHLPRIMHWIQNKDVEYYPTNISRQNYISPATEFTIAHLMILIGSDGVSNLIQWFAFVGSMIAASLLVKRLGGSLRAQLFSNIFVVTLPMAILQSTSTQTDLFASFWFVLFIYFGLLESQKKSWLRAVCAGLCLAVGLLTKATIYIFAFPFFIWMSWMIFQQKKSLLIQFLFISFIAVLVINSGYFYRNLKLYGTPVGSSDNYFNERISFSGLVSNLVKNIGMHLSTPSIELNSLTSSLIEKISSLAGADASDPTYTWPKTFFAVLPTNFNEDITTNTVHLLLISVSSILLISIKKGKTLHMYFFILSSSFLLFCLLLKWQPWNVRLHLPIFIAFAPLVAVVIEKNNHSLKYIGIISSTLFLFALPWVFLNETRPLLPFSQSILTKKRDEQYFSSNPALYPSYQQVADFVVLHKYSKIGIVTNQEAFEYGFWVLLKKKTSKFSLVHVDVNDISKKIPNTITPEFIVSDE